MKKRSCVRFNIPGTTLYYKARASFFKRPHYSDDYFPVLNLSRGGAQFLCNERMKAGKNLSVRITVPGNDEPFEVLADVKWIARNREASYQYQTGIAFNSYGKQKNNNPEEVLQVLKELEKKYHWEK